MSGRHIVVGKEAVTTTVLGVACFLRTVQNGFSTLSFHSKGGKLLYAKDNESGALLR